MSSKKTNTTTIKEEVVVNMPSSDQEKINSILTDVAVIKVEIGHLTGSIANLSVVPMQTFIDAKAEAEKEHEKIYKKIESVDKKAIAFDEWRDKIVSRIAVAAILFLVAAVLTLIGLEKYLFI